MKNILTSVALLCLLVSLVVQAQNPKYTSTNLNITFALYSRQLITNFTLSPYFPNDKLNTYALSTDHLIIMDTYNYLQIFHRGDPNIKAANIDQLIYSTTYLNFTQLTMNLPENTIVLTSHTRGHLQHFSYSWNSSTLKMEFRNVTAGLYTSISPIEVTVKGELIFAFFRNTTNDTVYITNVTNNVSWTVTLPWKNCQASVSPTRQKVILWSRDTSELYIHSLNSTFTLEKRYNTSLTSSANVPQKINYNYNGQLAIIQYNGIYPITIINMTDFSIFASIALNRFVYNAVFLDKINRFILIQTYYAAFNLDKDIVYDLHTSLSTFYTMDLYFVNKDILIDHQKGVMYIRLSKSVAEFGIHITANNQKIVQFVPENINISSNTNTNQSTNPQSSTPPNPFVQENPFSKTLSYNQPQTKALFYINQMTTTVNQIIDYSFSFIFSSPLALLFLNTFNYFNLSSLYILLNIRVPYEIFVYFQQLFNSCQSNALEKIEAIPKIGPLSNEKVTNVRALYFGVTSDIVSKNQADFMILVANIIFIEMVILISSISCLKKMQCFKTLKKQKLNIYWGVLVSSMVNLILPWKYGIFGGANNFATKMNLAAQHIIFITLLVLVIWSFFMEIQRASQAKRKHFIRIAIRKWWTSYENFIYPLLVLFQSPYYFLGAIGLSQLIYLYNSFYVPRLKIFAILKALYPIGFHICFILFLIIEDTTILANVTVACLSVFLVGSLHFLIETGIQMLIMVKKVIKKICGKKSINQVSDVKKQKKQKSSKKKEEKSLKKKQNEDVVEIKGPKFVVKVVGFKDAARKIQEQSKQKKQSKKARDDHSSSHQNKKEIKTQKEVPKIDNLEHRVNPHNRASPQTSHKCKSSTNFERSKSQATSRKRKATKDSSRNNNHLVVTLE